jgi:hypothetical protein
MKKNWKEIIHNKEGESFDDEGSSSFILPAIRIWLELDAEIILKFSIYRLI